MGLTFEVKRTDHGWKEFQERVKEIRARKPYVKTGVIGQVAKDAHPEVEHAGKTKVFHPGTITNVRLAVIHEFGAPDAGIHERSFLREPFRTHKPEYKELLGKLLKRVLHGKMPLEAAFGLAGQRIAADCKKWFVDADNGWMQNSPATIERKGSSRPLIDTGILRNSITYAVVADGGSEPASGGGGESA